MTWITNALTRHPYDLGSLQTPPSSEVEEESEQEAFFLNSGSSVASTYLDWDPFFQEEEPKTLEQQQQLLMRKIEKLFSQRKKAFPQLEGAEISSVTPQKILEIAYRSNKREKNIWEKVLPEIYGKNLPKELQDFLYNFKKKSFNYYRQQEKREAPSLASPYSYLKRIKKLLCILTNPYKGLPPVISLEEEASETSLSSGPSFSKRKAPNYRAEDTQPSKNLRGNYTKKRFSKWDCIIESLLVRKPSSALQEFLQKLVACPMQELFKQYVYRPEVVFSSKELDVARKRKKNLLKNLEKRRIIAIQEKQLLFLEKAISESSEISPLDILLRLDPLLKKEPKS